MHIETFATPEQMQEYLADAKAHAAEGLHTVQAQIAWGQHWVRFVDLDRAIIEFGRVFTRDDLFDMSRAAGDTQEETIAGINAVERQQEIDHLLYGRAHSILSPAGEDGVTHKAHVWPIEPRLFAMAMDVEFDYRNLGDVGRFLLNLAFSQMRAHVVGR